MFVGWDWANETHDVSVLDQEGDLLDRWSLRHDEEGIDAALARLASHGAPGELPVAIETTSGVIVDRLLEAGHPVVPIHPNAFNAARPRWGASRAKSDPGDSFKLADYLRTDGHRLRRLSEGIPDDSGGLHRTLQVARVEAGQRTAREPARQEAGLPAAFARQGWVKLALNPALGVPGRFPMANQKEAGGGWPRGDRIDFSGFCRFRERGSDLDIYTSLLLIPRSVGPISGEGW